MSPFLFRLQIGSWHGTWESTSRSHIFLISLAFITHRKSRSNLKWNQNPEADDVMRRESLNVRECRQVKKKKAHLSPSIDTRHRLKLKNSSSWKAFLQPAFFFCQITLENIYFIVAKEESNFIARCSLLFIHFLFLHFLYLFEESGEYCRLSQPNFFETPSTGHSITREAIKKKKKIFKK